MKTANKSKVIEELLNKNGYIVYTITGCSMMPLLRQKRDIVEIRKKSTNHYAKYDIILYRRGNDYVLHRVIEVLTEGYIIAGDNNTYLEKDIKEEEILGIMTRVIRDGKSIPINSKAYKAYVHLWWDFYPLRFRIINLKSKFCA